MKGNVNSIKKIIACFLLILFMGYASSVTLFQHEHIIDGRRVTHSHIYSDASETEQHTHTSYEFITIANLSILHILAVSLGCPLMIFAVRLLKNADFEKNVSLARISSAISLRGPPVY